MAARRKLDALGIKIELAQWQQLGRKERLMICHAPNCSEEERDTLRTFIEEATIARAGSAHKTLPEDVSPIRASPAHPPTGLADHARASGVELDDAAWARLDDDQRYALIKLGDGARTSHNFKAALAEFFGA